VGGKRPVPVDVRVVATTNRDLKEHIEKARFRQDLFYRLNVIPLHIPPLRQRPGDILLLADYFLNQFAAENHKEGMTIGDKAQKLLAGQEWPGNVRELMNTIERAVLLSQDPVINPETLMFEETGAPAPTGALSADQLGLPPTLRDAERVLIDRALEHTDGNRTHAAKILGISVRTLRNKLNEYKVSKGL
ncbi:MAG: helix-turn-helix domain-containing protein, partial [Desulfarculaceae bacterium]|jgi:two-component system response regulator FlrC